MRVSVMVAKCQFTDRVSVPEYFNSVKACSEILDKMQPVLPIKAYNKIIRRLCRFGSLKRSTNLSRYFVLLTCRDILLTNTFVYAYVAWLFSISKDWSAKGCEG